MNDFETIMFWLTALLLAASLFSSVLGMIFGRTRAVGVAQALLLGATVTLTILGGVRWGRTGHPPFVSLFESMLASIWFLLVIFQLVRWKVPGAAVVLPPVAGLALLLIGWSSSLSGEATPLSASLQNVWLFIHASFATAGAGTFLIGAAYSVNFLLGEERYARLGQSIKGLPRHADLPRTVTTFLLFGLVLWGVMIVSGSIWAHVAWGRYWAWDPVELWSLLSWLLYGLLYHARMAWRMPPRVFCILNIVAAGTVAFALWGIQYVYETIHTYG